jgi:hypothetical protein
MELILREECYVTLCLKLIAMIFLNNYCNHFYFLKFLLFRFVTM